MFVLAIILCEWCVALLSKETCHWIIASILTLYRTEENKVLYPKINYCLPFSWLQPALASYALDGDILKLNQITEEGEKIKHLWQLQSNLDIQHWTISSKL